MSEQQDSIESITVEPAAQPHPVGVGIQAGAYLLELSLDWIVLRASENAHKLLGESHVTLIDEPLGRFVRSEALHDLRNLFSRLSGTTGIGRAYRVRLTDEPDLVDVAFQVSDGRVVLEVTPVSDEAFGTAFGTVGGLIAGLSDSSGPALLDAGARRMRALTGYDRVTLLIGRSKATSSRSGVPFSSDANSSLSPNLPAVVLDSAGSLVPVFPRDDGETAIGAALLRAPTASESAELTKRGFASTMRVPVAHDGKRIGEFRLAHTTPRTPSFELHAAAELFAQLFAMRLEIDRLKSAKD